MKKERLLLALSSRTGADREWQQRIGYDAFAEPTMIERFLRTAAIASPSSEKKKIRPAAKFLTTRSCLLRQTVGQLFQTPTAGKVRC